jgi:CBS domain-containing protein
MVREPLALEASASAREAGEHLAVPDVRAVLVCEDGRLVGVVTRKTLVREVVAAGRDPESTPLGEIAEPPVFTLPAEMEVDEAFRALEEHDLERVPVVDGDRLVGIVSIGDVVKSRILELEHEMQAVQEYITYGR